MAAPKLAALPTADDGTTPRGFLPFYLVLFASAP